MNRIVVFFIVYIADPKTLMSKFILRIKVNYPFKLRTQIQITPITTNKQHRPWYLAIL